MKSNITVIVLSYNEDIHIERCLNSLFFAGKIIVVDSFSTDSTISKARYLGATTYQNPFINQAIQFQWALDNCPIETDWVMRIDADEYVTAELATEIQEKISTLNNSITGIILKRQVHFMGRWIKYGGYYPIKLLRIWRNGVGSIEQRWMDEHIKLSHGNTIEFNNDIVDENLNNLTWWISKHNNYATREAVDLLNKKYALFKEDSIDKQIMSKKQDEQKRWYKDNIYVKMPLFIRPFIYFGFRFIFKLGFLDGKSGLIWNVLQCFWYRFLVDAKIAQIEYFSKKFNKPINVILQEYYNFNI
jgi:glycosyltransferase involved in cell wall biosynthesis